MKRRQSAVMERDRCRIGCISIGMAGRRWDNGTMHRVQ